MSQAPPLLNAAKSPVQTFSSAVLTLVKGEKSSATPGWSQTYKMLLQVKVHALPCTFLLLSKFKRFRFDVIGHEGRCHRT